MSNELERRLEQADRVNPGLFRIFRIKRPGLYLACARKIRKERGICFLFTPVKERFTESA